MRRIADEELGLGVAFVQQPSVVKPLVGIVQPLKDGLDLEIAIARGADKLVGDGKTEHAASKLMPGIDGEDVAANGLGLFGLVEISVQLDFGNGFGDASLGDGFQLMTHGTSSFTARHSMEACIEFLSLSIQPPRIFRNSMVKGS